MINFNFEYLRQIFRLIKMFLIQNQLGNSKNLNWAFEFELKQIDLLNEKVIYSKFVLSTVKVIKWNIA